MCNTETKLELVTGALKDAIYANLAKADEAMKTLERLNITADEFRKASESLSSLTCANAYIARVIEVADYEDIKKMESIMRFYSYQLRHKGSINGNDELSKAQAEVAELFDNLIIRFFEN